MHFDSFEMPIDPNCTLSPRTLSLPKNHLDVICHRIEFFAINAPTPRAAFERARCGGMPLPGKVKVLRSAYRDI